MDSYETNYNLSALLIIIFLLHISVKQEKTQSYCDSVCLRQVVSLHFQTPLYRRSIFLCFHGQIFYYPIICGKIIYR